MVGFRKDKLFSYGIGEMSYNLEKLQSLALYFLQEQIEDINMEALVLPALVLPALVPVFRRQTQVDL